MIRNTLFLSALLLSSTITETNLTAHPAKPTTSAPAAHKTGAITHRPEARPEAKCGRCNGAHGENSASRERGTDHKNKRSTETGRLERSERDLHKPGGRNETFGRDGHVLESHHDFDRERMNRHDGRDHDHDRVKTIGGHGYAQRNYSYHGHEFIRRTYYDHGVAYSRCYQPYFYRGISLYVYSPGYYYTPAFYGWAYHPWVAPIVWNWGWEYMPWYRHFGGWFRPYAVYNSPSLWLTDYLVARTLESAYEQRVETAAATRDLNSVNFTATAMTPGVKEAVAQEVRRQLALENAEAMAGRQNAPDPASSGLARILGDHATHVFVVATPLDVTSNDGRCSVTEGDVLQLRGETAPNAVNADLMVLATKGNDCRKGAIVNVGLVDLQEMQNHMRATLDQGLSELHRKQGQGGLPVAPAGAAKPPIQTDFAAIAPPPDPNGEAVEVKQPAIPGLTNR